MLSREGGQQQPQHTHASEERLRERDGDVTSTRHLKTQQQCIVMDTRSPQAMAWPMTQTAQMHAQRKRESEEREEGHIEGE